MKKVLAFILCLICGLSDIPAQQSPGGSGGGSRRMDANGDGKISREEFPGPKEYFDQFDKDKDNFLSEAERNAMREDRGRNGLGGRGNRGGPFRRPGSSAEPNQSEKMFSDIDSNGDKSLSPAEWQAYYEKILSAADTNQDKKISALEWQAWRNSNPTNPRPGNRGNGGPEVGEGAPSVSAQFMTQKGELEFNKITRLSVIIFGSYT